MKWIHYTFTKTVGSSTYRFRLYSNDGAGHYAGAYGGVHGPQPRKPGDPFHKNSLAQHYFELLDPSNPDIKCSQVELHTELLRSFGRHGVDKDSEVSQGIPEYQMFSIELASVPELMDLIEAIRDPETQVWLEVVLVQPVLDAEPLPGRFCAPRRERMLFWGRMARPESKENVKRQQTTTAGRSKSYKPKANWHLGTISLSFVHWLKIRCEESVTDVLTEIRQEHCPITVDTDLDIQVSKVLYRLLKYISPTPLIACSDWRLMDLPPKSGATEEHQGAVDIAFTYTLIDDTNAEWTSLDDVWVPIGKWSKFKVLFENLNNQPGQNSLFSLKDIGELLFKLTGEFFLFPQVEIPTMEEAWKYFHHDNKQHFRWLNWPGVTRWLFLEQDKPAIEAYLDPIKETIEVVPAATWTSQYKVDHPTGDKNFPAPVNAISKGIEGGREESYKTLLRFVGWTYILGGAQQDDHRGFEMWVNGDQPFPNNRVIKKVKKDGKEYTSWAAFHADQRMSVWGSVKSTLSFKSRTHALEPFGANDKLAGAPNPRVPEKTFDTGDFGDFPLLRRFVARPGLMPHLGKDQMYNYVIYSIERAAGEPADVKLIEIGPLNEAATTVADGPAPPPPHEDGPTGSYTNPPPGSTVSGLVPVTLAVTQTGDPTVSQVTVYVDDKLLDTKVVTLPSADLPGAGATTEWSFDWYTTQFADGLHTLRAEFTDELGNVGTSIISVTVNNTSPPP